MNISIYIWAYLCSQESVCSLESFRKGSALLNEGVGLLSNDFFQKAPELRPLGLKYSRVQISSIRDRLQRSLDAGDWLLHPDDPQYPKAYLFLEEVPFLLHVRGQPVWKKAVGLSVVGHREPSQQSLDWLEIHLGSFIRNQDCMIVSGGARGVDQKAHSLALRLGRPTVVLLPSGLDQIYPTSLKSWVPDILKSGGALISEYDDDRKMQKHYFAQRNRLISGLGCATLIIEARRHSGTMLTAQEAIDQGRPVWVLPGHPMDPRCHGSLSLIREGATPVLDADELSSYFGSEIQGISGFWRDNPKYLVGRAGVTH
jgi:DNA protecting protein DprA